MKALNRVPFLFTERASPEGVRVDQDEFPGDLTGHYWTTLDYRPAQDRWAFQVVDYQNNVLLSGLACSSAQAGAIVRAWDQVIARSGADPSME